MFWKFGFHSSSPIDSLLEKANITLTEILEQEQVLQEVKGQNEKLLAFLAKQENLKELLKLLTAKSKHSFLAIEILSCNVDTLYSSLFQYSLLKEFWEFLNNDEILDISASYFSRLNIILLQKRPKEMIEFIKSIENVVGKMLKHLKITAVTDIIMKLISMEEVNKGGVVDWLADQGLIEKLVENLDPRNDAFIHALVSQAILDIIAISYQSLMMDQGMFSQDSRNFQVLKSQLIQKLRSKLVIEKLVGFMIDRRHENSKSSLTHGINIIMELIRRYCTDVEQLEMQHQQYTAAMSQGKAIEPLSGESIPILASCMSDVFTALGKNMIHFIEILKDPHDVNGKVNTSMGVLEPVGAERLKTCELIAELIHAQYLFISSPLFEYLVQYYPVENSQSEGSTDFPKYSDRAIDGLLGVTEVLVAENVFEITVDLFFRFQWNNFLHSVVYDMIAKVLNSYSFILSVITPAMLDMKIADTKKLSVGQMTMMKARDIVKMLVLSIFEKGKVTVRILESDKLNREQESLPKGLRIGYMGHLTYLSEEIVKLTDKCGQDLGEKFQEYVFDDNWTNYITGPLKITKERDQKLLGGVRPDPQNILSQLGGFPGEDGPIAIQDGSHNYGDPDAYKTNWDIDLDFISDQSSNMDEQKAFHQTMHDFKQHDTGDNEIEFDVNEAYHSDTAGFNPAAANFKKEGITTWKADFEGAFGTGEMRSSLDSIKSTKSFNDAPGEEWTEFSSSEGS